jgi:hypothetical protein
MASESKKLIEGDRRRISITQQEIEKAAPQKSGRCLVARAIAAKFPDATRIDVDMQTIRFTRDGERWVYLTPWEVQRYITEFDAGDPIDPFQFTLTKSVQIQRRTRTAAGQQVSRAQAKARDSKKRLEQAEQLLIPSPEPGKPKPRPTPEAKAKLEELHGEAEAAAAEYDTVRSAARAADEPQLVSNRSDVPQRTVMTQRGVTKSRTSKRHYGAREMRINQDRADRKSVAVEAEAGLELPAMPRGGYAEDSST